MKEKRKNLFLLILFTILLFASNYAYLDSLTSKLILGESEVLIDRVIDGDTIVSNGTSIRLLGINTPEKREKYFEEAKKFLESKVLNKTVRLEYGKDKKDLYGRTLAYVFVGNENINQKLISNGFANAYFPSGKDKYYSSFFEAWNNCVKTNNNLCEKTDDFCGRVCIKISKFEPEKQLIEFENICPFDCDINKWTIKDEGRKKFVFDNFKLKSNKKIKIIVGNFSDSENILHWDKNYVWTRTGDTLFLRDDENNLVLWQNY